MSTTFGVSCILAIIATAGVISVGTEALLSKQEAQTAADMIALSGAMAVVSGDGEACGVAEAFAQANEVTLSSCETGAEMVTVGVEKYGRKATATAGPTEMEVHLPGS